MPSVPKLGSVARSIAPPAWRQIRSRLAAEGTWEPRRPLEPVPNRTQTPGRRVGPSKAEFSPSQNIRWEKVRKLFQSGSSDDVSLTVSAGVPEHTAAAGSTTRWGRWPLGIVPRASQTSNEAGEVIRSQRWCPVRARGRGPRVLGSQRPRCRRTGIRRSWASRVAGLATPHGE